MADDRVAEAAGEEILRSRALNYRKITIAICIVLGGMYAFQSINFSGLNVFGLKFEGEAQQQRATVLWIAWAFLAYHAGFFGYYAFRDFRYWAYKLIGRPAASGSTCLYFPEIRMYLGLPPKTKAVTTLGDFDVKDWKRSIGQDEKVFWTPARPKGLDPGSPFNRSVEYAVPMKLDRLVRAKLLWFALVDAGVPALLIIAAVVLAAVRS